MTVIGRIAEAYLAAVNRRLRRAAGDPAAAQRRVFERLLGRAAGTWFGRKHGFASIRDHADFARAVPIADYAGRKDMFDRILAGEPDVSWPGRVRYFADTSGTTAGIKGIPVTEEIRRSHARAVHAMFAYYARRGRGLFSRVLEGKLLFLGASATLEPTAAGGFHGDLSGIRMHSLPWWARRWYEPGLTVAMIPEWHDRIEAAAARLVHRDVRFLAGIPSWVMLLFDRLCALRGVPVEGGMSEVWPNLQVYMHGGVHFEPYRPILEGYFRPGRHPDYLGTYTASEGSIAVQAEADAPAMEVLTDNGLFYEWVPCEEWGSPAARRLTIDQVEPGVEYSVVVSNNAGLWAHDLDDVVRFTSVVPPRLLFVGRRSAYLNAFAEHTGGHEVSAALAVACRATGARVAEFTVAPVFPTVERHAAAHQYVVEFEREPAGGIEPFAACIDEALRQINSTYCLKRRDDKVLRHLLVSPVPRGTFHVWMEARGKLGGQNKVPVSASDRRYAEGLLKVAAEKRQPLSPQRPQSTQSKEI